LWRSDDAFSSALLGFSAAMSFSPFNRTLEADPPPLGGPEGTELHRRPTSVIETLWAEE